MSRDLRQLKVLAKLKPLNITQKNNTGECVAERERENSLFVGLSSKVLSDADSNQVNLSFISFVEARKEENDPSMK